MPVSFVIPSDDLHNVPGRKRSTPLCLYCGEECVETFVEGITDRLGYVDGKWNFLRCAKCASVVIDPMPQPEDLASFYPDIYSFAPELGQVGKFKSWLSKIESRFVYGPMYRGDARRVARSVAMPDGLTKTLLDIGCGRGLRLEAFRSLGFNVHGMDFQDSLVSYVSDKLGIFARRCEIGELSEVFRRGFYDLITGFYVVEHVPSVHQLLEQCFLLLRPGGWLAAAVPLIDSVQASYFRDRWIQIREVPRHLSIPSQAGLTRSLSAVGFGNIKLVPDGLFSQAASVGLSMFPRAASSEVYTSRNVGVAMARLSGMIATAGAIPWTISASKFRGRPAFGIVCGQKPLTD